ncbi:MAG: hypothetical protein QE271_12645 [Bacteriovoracaceae bacterium]|nr:hypothetical protein [Bacteriovoracaceae bacterium]
MKLKSKLTCTIFALISLGQNFATAQEAGKSITDKSIFGSINKDENPLSGLVVGVRKGFSQKAKSTAKFGDESLSDSTSDFAHQMGFSVGYSKNKLENFGIKTNLNYDSFKFDNEDDETGEKFSSFSGEGNVTYSVNKYLIPYAGLNISKFNKGEVIKELNPGIGYQIGITGEIANNFGYQFAYQALRNSGSYEFVNFEVNVSTLQLGIVAAF